MTAAHHAEEAAQLQTLLSGGTFAALLGGTMGVEAAKALAKLARTAPGPTLVGGLLVSLLVYSHWTSERGQPQRRAGKTLLREAQARLGEVTDAGLEAKRLVQSAAFVLEVEPRHIAHAARAVAVAAEPPRPSEVGSAIGVSTQMATYLLQDPMFVRANDGRYLLDQNLYRI